MIGVVTFKSWSQIEFEGPGLEKVLDPVVQNVGELDAPGWGLLRQIFTRLIGEIIGIPFNGQRVEEPHGFVAHYGLVQSIQSLLLDTKHGIPVADAGLEGVDAPEEVGHVLRGGEIEIDDDQRRKPQLIV